MRSLYAALLRPFFSLLVLLLVFQLAPQLATAQSPPAN